MDSIDATLFLWLNATPDTSAIWLDLARWLSVSLPAWTILGLVPLCFLGPRVRRQVAGAVMAMALAWLAVRAVRLGVHAPRPFELGLGHQWLSHAATSAFPSLHAAVAAAWAAGLFGNARHEHRAGWALTGVVALAIAWSRVFLGVHFASDVAVGLAVGAGCGWLSGRVLRKLLRPTGVLSPAVADGGFSAPGRS